MLTNNPEYYYAKHVLQKRKKNYFIYFPIILFKKKIFKFQG